MPIVPLPVFEAEADPRERGLSEEDIALYEKRQPPETVVVRYGYLRRIAELPANLEVVPGCGTKLVIRSPRGTEIGDMLTALCSNGGCDSSLTRREMLDYIEESGGKDYPFTTKGRVLRVATPSDLNEMAAIRARCRDMIREARKVADDLSLDMKIVEVEPILGGEQLTIYFMAEDRIDFREMVKCLAAEFRTRIEMRQVGARDEARLVADYERCGQHCCCKQFLKVLKPVSMRAAKMQKATLDPLKISGRCGRLMCCLRYEDKTYQELKKNLPHRKTRVGTDEGPGIVLDSQILTQLVLVELDHDRTRIAVPVENLMDPDHCPAPGEKRRAAEEEVLRGLTEEDVIERTDDEKRSRRSRRRRRGGRSKTQQQDAYREQAKAEPEAETPATTDAEQPATGKRKRRRRRGGRRRKTGGPTEVGSGTNQSSDTGDDSAGAPTPTTPTSSPDPTASPDQPQDQGGGGEPQGGSEKRKRKRRRRRRRKGRGGEADSGGS